VFKAIVELPDTMINVSNRGQAIPVSPSQLVRLVLHSLSAVSSCHFWKMGIRRQRRWLSGWAGNLIEGVLTSLAKFVKAIGHRTRLRIVW
jgi:hypothetical protein